MQKMTCAICRKTLALELFRVRPDGRRKHMCKACEGKLARKHGLKRRCHDCGAPTNNYRCGACWRRVRGSEANCPDSLDPQYLP